MSKLDDELRALENALNELRRQGGPLPRPRGPRGRALVAIAIVAAFAGGVAAVTFLTQTIPTIPVVGLTSLCSAPQPLTASNASVSIGESGHILFSCGSGPAFTAIAGTDATPTFILSPGYTGLSIYPVTANSSRANCANIFGHIGLTPGGGLILPGGGFNYCAEYSAAPAEGFASFDVAWTWTFG